MSCPINRNSHLPLHVLVSLAAWSAVNDYSRQTFRVPVSGQACLTPMTNYTLEKIALERATCCGCASRVRRSPRLPCRGQQSGGKVSQDNVRKRLSPYRWAEWTLCARAAWQPLAGNRYRMTLSSWSFGSADATHDRPS